MFYLQLRNELWKLFGKKRTYIGFGAFVVAQLGMLWAFQSERGQRSFERVLAGNGYGVTEYLSALTVAMVMLMPQAKLLMLLYTTLVGGDLVAKESEDGTLRMILSRPISRVRLLFVKWVAGCMFSVLLVVVLGICALAVARMLFPWKSMFVFSPGVAFSVLSAGDGLRHYLLAHVFMGMNACVMFSIAFLFSCLNIKPAAATIVALTIMIVSLVMEAIPAFNAYEDWLVTHHFDRWLLAFQSPVPWAQLFQSEIILLGFATSCFVIGCTAFQVRDIKS